MGNISPGMKVYLHRRIWEKNHGSIPKGHIVIFADSNRENYEIENLLLVSYREMAVMRQNGLLFDTIEKTKLGHVIAKHRLAIIDAIDRRNNQLTEVKTKIRCANMCSIRCPHFFSKTVKYKDAVCTKYNLPAKQLKAEHKSAKEYLKKVKKIGVKKDLFYMKQVMEKNANILKTE